MNLREQIQNEAYEALRGRSGCIEVVMRSGKTLIGLRLTQDYKKVLVAYPNKSIFESWKSDSEKFGIDISHVTFTTFASLPKFNLRDFDAVICDELQDLSESKLKFIQSEKPKILNGLTGTLPRKGSTKRFYIDILCPLRYEKHMRETVGTLTKPYHIYVHLVEPSEVRNIPKRSGGTWSERAKINYFETKANESFSMMIMLIQAISGSPTKWKKLVELLNTFDRCLVFVETIQQAQSICRYTYHSKNKEEVNKENLQKFNEGEVNFLATVNQLNAGITFPNLNKAVLLHSYASNSKATQRLSRALNFLEGENAELHVICMNNTRDLVWTRKGLEYYGEENITWIQPK